MIRNSGYMKITYLSPMDLETAKWWLDYLQKVRETSPKLVSEDDVDIAYRRYWDIRFKQIIEELSPNYEAIDMPDM